MSYVSVHWPIYKICLISTALTTLISWDMGNYECLGFSWVVYVIRNVSKKRFWLNIYRKKGSHKEVHPYAKQKLCSTAVMDELHLMNFKKAVWRAQ